MYGRVPPIFDKEVSLSVKDVATADENRSATSTQNTTTTAKKKVISDGVLQRFEALKKRTDDATRRSTEKRLKHLQKAVIDKVVEEFKHPEDIDELRKHDVKFGPPVTTQRKGDNSEINHEKTKPDEAYSQKYISKAEWMDVKQHLAVNTHLVTRAGPSHSKSGLEKQIDGAINKGDFSTAEKLSDSMAARDFGAKIAHAIDARDFLKRKKEERNQAKMKKKKKLAWGFEHKQRWETKSNM